MFPPRDPEERIVTKTMTINIIAISVLMAVAVLFLFNRFLPEGVTIARTVAFTTTVILEMVRVTMIRSQYGLSFFSNRYLIGAIFISIMLQMIVVYVPFMNVIFKTTPLSLHHWGYIGSVVVVMYVAGTAIVKRISR